MLRPRVLVLAVLLVSIAQTFAAPAHPAGGPPAVNTKIQVFALGQSRPTGARNVQQLPRRYPNPDLLKLLKQAMAAGKSIGSSKPSGGSGSSNPAPQTYPGTALAFGGNNGSQSFAGLGFLDSLAVPPDTIITAGTDGASTPTTYAFEAINLVGQFYSTTGGASTTLDLSSCTLNPGLDSVSDPRVLYDSGRWFISLTTFAPSADAGWDLIFSTSSDPTTTSWLCLPISTAAIRNPDGTTGNFPDFPKMGINSDKVVITGDAFTAVQRRLSTSYKFQGTEFVVVSKADLLNAAAGGMVGVSILNPPQGDLAIEPAQHLPVFPPPATLPVGTLTPSSLYMASVNSGVSSTSTLHIWTVSGLPGSVTVKVAPLTIHTLTLPPNARQSGTSALIDTNDDSLLDAVYRASSDQLWVSANDGCTPAGDSTVRACARYTDISIPTMSVAQDFDLAKAGNYYYFPAVRTNSNGTLVTAFTGSSSSTIPSVYGASRAAGDPVNQLSSLSIVHGGDTPYTISPPRWGDYSGVGVDPNDSTMWIAGEYATTCFLFGSCWGTWVASVP
jgi:hypothetical protein